MRSLDKKERKEIFKLFLEKSKLRFSDIEKGLDIRSNMVSYHIEQMVKEGLLEKKEGLYKLTADAERYIPIFSLIIGQDISPLPAVLVALINDGKILLIKRNKRPYRDYWAMVGGKMLLEETFQTTSLRLIKDKAGLEGEFFSINSVMQEHVKQDNAIKHSFILFFTKVKTDQIEFKNSESGELAWFDTDKLPERIVPSDRWLIENRLDSIADVKNAYMDDVEGELSSFEISKTL